MSETEEKLIGWTGTRPLGRRKSCTKPVAWKAEKQTAGRCGRAFDHRGIQEECLGLDLSPVSAAPWLDLHKAIGSPEVLHVARSQSHGRPRK